ncbi:MAG: type IV pili methyl-accepting chemotaxis transducer N-terminal domain-containing protein [Azonexus sp.]|jgi:nitrate/nitrite-specific signal transduction histidine kinase|uniref:type IV pili methyl-accepting chemotaxis transducer N-terminal domain-containing protein n=1 Tax=Azonexus sp. TaxID=1872668 RepID=UPI00281AE062|nr:type IV pili methyl-accepting chemotaxis transducer N-terminal domain-containing protein [Azonexus sp.]MDR0777574.1 type IV pili methyl-accepting chemotaxis transducer N-terminal domain-containing protein [Azonexus sp.]
MRALSSALLALILVVAGGEALAQITDINMAINKAGRQRMLSQRMARAYFQIGMQVDTENSKRILDSSVATFDRQLVELKNFAPTPEIRSTYQKLETAWLAYKDVLLGSAPSQENGRKVLAISDEVLAIAHQGTVQLEKLSGTTSGRLVNASGLVRMRSQRMAKFYQAIAWGVADDRSAANLAAARKDFIEALQELTKTPVNTQQIKESLELVAQQWMFFEHALNQKGSGDSKRQSLAVATTSERILEEIEITIGLYEKMQK